MSRIRLRFASLAMENMQGVVPVESSPGKLEAW